MEKFITIAEINLLFDTTFDELWEAIKNFGAELFTFFKNTFSWLPLWAVSAVGIGITAAIILRCIRR